MSEITIFRDSCKGIEDCGICIFVCPKGLFESSGRMNELGYVPPQLTDEAPCTACGNCMIFCPDMAIVMEKDQETK